MKKYQIRPAKTYANEKNAQRAVDKVLENNPHLDNLPNQQQLIYSIIWNSEGRCFPVFYGSTALQCGMHHLGFNCLAFG